MLSYLIFIFEKKRSMPRNERWTIFAYLAWMAFLSVYWISLFSNSNGDTSSALLPVGTGFVLVAAAAYGLLYPRRKLAFGLLIALMVHTISFSWLAHANDAACGCYRISWVDFLPDAIGVLMTFVLLISRRRSL